MEKIDFSGNVSDYNFMVEGTQITVMSGSNTVATFLSLNQDCTLRFANGSAILSLTGMNAATLGGSSIGTTSTDVTQDYMFSYSFNQYDVSQTIAITGTPAYIYNQINVLNEWILS
ncbi:MAG: hypothetical protein HQK77_16595 [Desulfobacterales bacterium]|nr:hypothetical protein [Desulfobacterales bacterium]